MVAPEAHTMTDEPVGKDARVSYSVKELLDTLRIEQSAGFARVEARLDDKASRHELAAIREQQERHQHELDDHELRLGEVEKREDKDQAILKDRRGFAEQHRERNRWVVGTALTLAFTIIIILQFLQVHA
jgi:ferric-dicitrate binding protein FerR (iron transport regulator)